MTATGQRVWDSLTRRERELLLALCSGPESFNEICDQLVVNRETMKNYMSRLGEKTGMSGRLEIMFFAWANRMVPCPCGHQEKAA